MKRIVPKFSLDIKLAFDSDLGRADLLDRLQALLLKWAPAWAKKFHIYEDDGAPLQVDSKDPGALRGICLYRSKKRKEIYDNSPANQKPGPFHREFWTEELRGANRSLTIILSADAWMLAPCHGAWDFGNTIAIQIRRPTVEQRDAASWCEAFLEDACAKMSPIWASAHATEEYWAKNIYDDDGVVAAIGRDVSRYLPGLYWMNFFGRVYCDLIGNDRLASAPCKLAKPINDGFMLALFDDPNQWETSVCKQTNSAVLSHLGPEYFFSRRHSNAQSRAPDFNFAAHPSKHLK